MKLEPTVLFEKKIIVEEITTFTRHLATFLKSGDSLQRSLNVLRDRVWTSRIRKMIKAVEKDVNSGRPLSAALTRHRYLFPPTYVQAVRTGELNGNLGRVLAELAEVIEKEYVRHIMFSGAFVYPTTMAIIAMGVISFLFIKIIPTFAEMFRQMGVPLPLPTKIVIGMSAFLVKYWLLCLIGVVAFTATFVWLSKPPRVRAFLDKLRFSLPVTGETAKRDYTCRVTRILGILVTCGVDVIQALRSVRDVTDNLHISSVLNEMAEQLQKGCPLSKAFKDSNFFPEVLVAHIAEAEKAGTIGKHLLEFANRYDTVLDEAVAAMSSLQEPLLTVAMGAAIGLIVMAMFFPMFEMINLVDGDDKKPARIKTASVRRHKMEVSDTATASGTVPDTVSKQRKP